MRRSIFSMGFANGGSWDAAGIPVYGMKKTDVDRDRAGVLRRLPVPPGTTVNFPYMVKTGEGEYWVRADGTTSYYSYRWGRWEPPQFVDNRSMLAKMFGHED